ncbi:MAG: flavohemoprotein [Deltaproteobacteria bacterium]|nr:MAG: flavohemoprotein [Deltaproteobacteria bacterium]
MLDVQVLRDSFKWVAPKADLLMERFYERLFAQFPQVKPMFANTSMKIQQTKLLHSLTLIIARVDQPEKLQPYLYNLGGRHVGYGAKPEHYLAVGECLLGALEETAGPAWTEEVSSTWIAAYDAIQTMMLQGAEEVASQQKQVA